MRKTFLLALGLMISLTFGQAQAYELTGAISESSVLGHYARGYQNGSARSEFSWLYVDENNASKRNLVSGGYYVNIEYDEISFRIGGKVFWAEARENDGGGFAGGGQISYHFNHKILIQLAAHFSPSITSGKDIKHLNEIDFRTSLKLDPKVGLFVGYRNVDVDLERGGSDTVHEGAYLGMRLFF